MAGAPGARPAAGLPRAATPGRRGLPLVTAQGAAPPQRSMVAARRQGASRRLRPSSSGRSARRARSRAAPAAAAAAQWRPLAGGPAMPPQRAASPGAWFSRSSRCRPPTFSGPSPRRCRTSRRRCGSRRCSCPSAWTSSTPARRPAAALGTAAAPPTTAAAPGARGPPRPPRPRARRPHRRSRSRGSRGGMPGCFMAWVRWARPACISGTRACLRRCCRTGFSSVICSSPGCFGPRPSAPRAGIRSRTSSRSTSSGASALQ
mmetsp:Transcript_77477/g.250717  ORF Transcript_77477/g.250717 Transcript_77477/m.250717 type:complete len:261 (-) Transcript_77477:967-1749(-)